VKTSIHFLSYFAQFFLEWEIFETKVLEKIKTHFVFNNFFFFSENHTAYERMWKNTVEPDRPKWQYGVCTVHAGYVRLQTHRVCITCCFTIAEMVARTRLSVSVLRTLHVHVLNLETLIIQWTKAMGKVWYGLSSARKIQESGFILECGCLNKRILGSPYYIFFTCEA